MTWAFKAFKLLLYDEQFLTQLAAYSEAESAVDACAIFRRKMAIVAYSFGSQFASSRALNILAFNAEPMGHFECSQVRAV